MDKPKVMYKKAEFDLFLSGKWIPMGELAPTCAECKAFLPNGVKFCPECGAGLHQEKGSTNNGQNDNNAKSTRRI